MASAEQGAKLESKLGLHLGGYQKRQKMLKDKVGGASEALEKARNALSGFKTLAISEDVAIDRRLAALREEVGFCEPPRERGAGGVSEGQGRARRSAGWQCEWASLGTGSQRISS